jgi:uncharacterized protein (TIGR02391 family)
MGMATRRVPPQSQPPTLSALQAVNLLRRQLERSEEIGELKYDDPKIDGWKSTTQAVLDGAFGIPNGEPERRTKEFLYASGGSMRINMSRGEIQRHFVTRLNNQRALLNAFVEQLEDGIPPAIATAIDQYRFHSAIDTVSANLLRDGHYKQAALEAFICVIEQVKIRSGRTDLEGDNLINHVLGSENRTPILKFNALHTDAERDEQKGIMFLFKGVVALRNAKSHSNTLFDSPQRAHEYLALASLLMRLLEIAVNA